MIKLVESQMALSTAEEQEQYFSGWETPQHIVNINDILPAGKYRVIDGELCRIVDASPELVRSLLEREC